MITSIANHRNTSSSQQQGNIKTRDDRQILERLAQQANKFNTSERSNVTRDHHPFRNLQSALFSTTYEHLDRREKRIGVPESEVKI